MKQPAWKTTAGFSLVEVIIALAILGAVLVSISGLFVLGARGVYSGRTHSTALAAARNMLEQIGDWTFDQTYKAFELDPTTTGNESGPVIDTRVTDGYAARWQPDLTEELAEAFATIEIRSIDDGGGTPPDLQDARAIRVKVNVFWTEGLRSRQVTLAMVRM